MAALDRGYEVACVINETKPRIKGVPERVLQIIPKAVLLDGSFEGRHCFDHVIHCATQYGRSEQPDDSKIDECNVALPRAILASEGLKPTGTFINCDTFFNSEIELPGRMNRYVHSKRVFRDHLSDVSKDNDYRIINAIIHQMFSPNDRGAKFFPFIVSQVLAEEQNVPMTPGMQLRDFISAASVAEILLLALQANNFEKGISTIEIGNGIGTSIRDFTQYVVAHYKTNATFDFGALPYRENEIMSAVADVSDVVRLGYIPKQDLSEIFEVYLSEIGDNQS